MTNEIECTECEGDGIHYGPENEESDCVACEGEGTVEAEEEICATCDGSGEGSSWSMASRCWACNGSGMAVELEGGFFFGGGL